MPSLRELKALYTFIHLGRIAGVALVDKIDGEEALKLNWGARKQGYGGKSYCVRASVSGREQKSISLHHFVAERMSGPKPSPEHVCEALNGDYLDCRRENLHWVHKDETQYKLQKRAAEKAKMDEWHVERRALLKAAYDAKKARETEDA